MAQFPTKMLANVGAASGSNAGNPGTTFKYHTFCYTLPTLPAAITAAPIGIAPCKCTYIGYSVVQGRFTSGTASVTYTPLKIPYDAGGTTVAMNTTDTLFATTTLGGGAGAPAFCSSVNFEGAGTVLIRGSNATTTTTGITAPVIKTDSSVQFRQGDAIGLTTAGDFTGLANVMVVLWLREDNGAY